MFSGEFSCDEREVCASFSASIRLELLLGRRRLVLTKLLSIISRGTRPVSASGIGEDLRPMNRNSQCWLLDSLSESGLRFSCPRLLAIRQKRSSMKDRSLPWFSCWTGDSWRCSWFWSGEVVSPCGRRLSCGSVSSVKEYTGEGRLNERWLSWMCSSESPADGLLLVRWLISPSDAFIVSSTCWLPFASACETCSAVFLAVIVCDFVSNNKDELGLDLLLTNVRRFHISSVEEACVGERLRVSWTNVFFNFYLIFFEDEVVTLSLSNFFFCFSFCWRKSSMKQFIRLSRSTRCSRVEDCHFLMKK